MTRHLGSRTLSAFDAGTLAGRRGRRACEHLAACSTCRAALRRRREVRDAARAATSPAAPDILARIESRLDQGARVILPEGRLPPATRPAWRRHWAAVLVGALLVTAGSGAAAVATGAISLDRILGRAPGGTGVGEVGEPAGVDLPVPEGGLALVLGDDLGSDVRLRVRAGTADSLASVVGREGAASVRFLVGIDRVTVGGALAGVVEVAVPRGARGPVHLIRGGEVVGVVLDGAVRVPGRDPVASLDIGIDELDVLARGRVR